MLEALIQADLFFIDLETVQVKSKAVTLSY